MSIDDKDYPKIEDSDSDPALRDCLRDSTLMSLMRTDTNLANLDAVRQSMIHSLSVLPSGFLQDRKLLDSLSLASRLLFESFEETENNLVKDSPNVVSTREARARIDLWQSSLEPWHEFMKNLKNLGAVPCDSVEKLLYSLPDVVQVVFNHCKRSESLYGRKFDDLRSQLTSLYRQADVLLDVFFSIVDGSVNFDVESTNENNALVTVLNKIGDIAVLSNGINLKCMMSGWKIFAKLATVHESLVKKSLSIECVTRRYADIAKDIQTLLFSSFQENKDTNYERTIKCVGLLLKILGKLCTVYRGYCGNEVSTILVQLLAKLYRYTPPFPYERFASLDSKIIESIETHIVQAAGDLLKSLLDENEFPKALLRYGKSELKEPVCYHLLTLRIIEELTKEHQSDCSRWLSEDDNIIDILLTNVDRCCSDFLINELQVTASSTMISSRLDNPGIYETTLRLVCQLISRTSVEDFPAVEMALLEHLVNGDFWSSLLSCDSWTYLGRIASPELCYEHLSILTKIQRALVTREKSLGYAIVCSLIGRLYKLLPEAMQESFFGDFDDWTDGRFVEPFRKSLSITIQRYLCQRSSHDATNNLGQIFQDLRRSPSMKNWTRLICLLRSMGAGTIPIDRSNCTIAIGDIWKFLASSISKTDGINREMLLELAMLLFDCTQPDSSDDPINDRPAASIYSSMLEAVKHMPIQHRIRINVFLRDNLESCINDSGKQSLTMITELFCYLINEDNPWIRQESFETYAEYIIHGSSVRLLDALSIGINKSSRICRQMQSYLSNREIHEFSRHASLVNYLRELANTSMERTNWHTCYEPDFRQRDEKMPRLEINAIDKRVDDICNEIRYIAGRRNELSVGSREKLHGALLELLETS